MKKQTKIICMSLLSILFLCKCGYGNYSISPMVSGQEKLESESLEINADGNLGISNNKDQEYNVQQKMQKEKTPDCDGKVIEQKSGFGKYKGGIKNGKREGYGEYYIPITHNFYKGYWKDDKRNGFGIEYMPCGKYEGMWKDGLQNGPGIVYNSFGKKQIGTWKDHEMVGYGAVYNANGEKMFGCFEKDKIKDEFIIVQFSDESFDYNDKVKTNTYIGEYQFSKYQGYGVSLTNLVCKNNIVLLKTKGEFKDSNMDCHGGCGQIFCEDSIILCKHFILLDNNIANNADGVMKELTEMKNLILPTYAYVDNTLWYYNGKYLPRECIVNIQNSGEDFIQQLQQISNEQLDLQRKLKAILEASKKKIKNKFDLICMYDGVENKNVQGAFQIHKNEQVIIPEDAREFITSYNGFIKNPETQIFNYNAKEYFPPTQMSEKNRILIEQMLVLASK